MDADLSHDPLHLPQMVAATDQYDVVVGSRYSAGAELVDWPGYRAVLSRCANAYVRAVTGLHARDCTSGYRCWRRETVQRMRWDRIGAEGFAFLVETLCEAAQMGCVIGEVPVVFVGRRHGASKLTARVVRESLIVPWRVLLRFCGRTLTVTSSDRVEHVTCLIVRVKKLRAPGGLRYRDVRRPVTVPPVRS